MDSKAYYDVMETIKKYPNAWIYLVVGGRTTGKTYSALKMCIKENKKFCFIKRTMDDVNLICSGQKLGQKANKYGEVDFSPFKPLNRDFGWNIKAFSIDKGLGGFYETDFEGNPIGEPLGYIWALSGITKFKGFDVSECDYIIFDEFIPQPWDRVNTKEGEQLLDLYITVSRDREMRGREPLKVVCLANATKIHNPVFKMLEVIDRVVDMELRDEHELYIEERGIYIERLASSPEFHRAVEQMKIYQSMKDTEWGKMAFGNEFAYDDFSQVQNTSLKKFYCMISLQIGKQRYYIYKHQDKDLYYITTSQSNSRNIRHYNMNTTIDITRFQRDELYWLYNATINGMVKFANYTMYEMVSNFRKFFGLK